VFVACSTLCFARHSLEDALRIIAEMEFNKFDVAIHEHGKQVKPSEVAADVHHVANRLRLGPGLMPAAFSIEIDAASEEASQQQFKAICRLARISAVSVLSIPAAPAEVPIEEEIDRLKHLVRQAEADGVQLTVTTRMGTLTEDPDVAVSLCEQVPGLGLTLDPSHYLAGPHQGKCFDQVYPHVRHVHLRDTGKGPEQFQVRVGQGQVEYGRIISHLSRFSYNRVLTVDINDIPDLPYAVQPEVRKLKYLLESLV
jgi:sugar phosphate isomerase/epimerase